MQISKLFIFVFEISKSLFLAFEEMIALVFVYCLATKFANSTILISSQVKHISYVFFML